MKSSSQRLGIGSRTGAEEARLRSAMLRVILFLSGSGVSVRTWMSAATMIIADDDSRLPHNETHLADIDHHSPLARWMWKQRACDTIASLRNGDICAKCITHSDPLPTHRLDSNCSASFPAGNCLERRRRIIIPDSNSLRSDSDRSPDN